MNDVIIAVKQSKQFYNWNFIMEWKATYKYIINISYSVVHIEWLSRHRALYYNSNRTVL